MKIFEYINGNPIPVLLVICGIVLLFIFILILLSKGYRVNFKYKDSSVCIEHSRIENLVLGEETFSGFVRDYETATDSDMEVLLEVKHSIDFLGVSGIASYVLYNRKSFNSFQIKKNNTMDIRFLLLDPNSVYVDEHARREGIDPLIVRNDILTSVEHLFFVKRKQPNLNIKIRFYDSKPLFRIFIVDSAKAFVGYYGYTTDNPCISFQRKENGKSLYYVMEDMFETMWNMANYIGEEDLVKYKASRLGCSVAETQ